MRNTKWGAVRRTAAVVAVAPLFIGLAACGGTADVGGDFAAERKTVEAFLTALERGDAQQASTYLSDKSSFPADALTNDFYATAVDHPEGARIALATENEGTVYVQVDYRLGSDDRELSLVMSGGDDPRIDSWSGIPTILRSATGEGRVSVSDALTIDVGAAASYASLLPGRYTLSYTGTGAGTGIAPFELDFPVAAPGADSQLPTGVRFAGGALEFGR